MVRMICRLSLVLAFAIATGAMAQEMKVGKLAQDSAFVFLSGKTGGKDRFGFTPQEIFAASQDGKSIVQLTTSGYTHNHLSVSPDRRYIASNRYVYGDTTGDGRLQADDFKEMWIIDLEAGREWPVARGMSTGHGGIGWSHDSEWVYFSSFADPTKTVGYRDGLEIYRVRKGGGDLQRVTGNLNRLMGDSGQDKFVSDLDVSPDGQWLALNYKPSWLFKSGRAKARVALVRVDGTAARVLTDGGPLAPQMRGRFGVGDLDPDFSPDGKRIAFSRVTETGFVHKGSYHDAGLSTADLFVIDVDGRNLKNLSPPGNPGTVGIASWGDNCKILYTYWTDAPRPRRVAQYVNADGSGLTTIDGLPDDVNKAQWLPGIGPAGAC